MSVKNPLFLGHLSNSLFRRKNRNVRKMVLYTAEKYVLTDRIYNFLCDPSQNGAFFDCLHIHQNTVFISVISTAFGVKPDPLCDPSQKG